MKEDDEREEERKVLYLLSPEANEEMDPAVHRVTNQTRKSTTRYMKEGLGN